MILFSSVAALYAVVLVLGALWVLGAHRWLAFFARLEHRLIDNVTLSADDYTVIVKDLPPNISEKSLQVSVFYLPLHVVRILLTI